jgi:hypothetical protein
MATKKGGKKGASKGGKKGGKKGGSKGGRGPVGGFGSAFKRTM